MEKLVVFKGLVVPVDMRDVDTDQIVPRQFLKLINRDGFGQYLFYHHRYDERGNPTRDFVLQQLQYSNATILLARENFGCGSSREHAAWALLDYGFRVLIAPSFADIFKNNCFKNGMLPVELEQETVAEWFKRVEGIPGYEITLDLPNQTLTGTDGFSCSFEVDPFHKRCLMEGLDDISLTLNERSAIEAYEKAHREPWQAFLTKTGHDSEVGQ